MNSNELRNFFIKPLRDLNVRKAVILAMERNTDLFQDAQILQFDSGKNSDGSKRKAYTPYTKKIKKKKGQPADRVTLRDTGAFYNATTAKASNQGVWLTSTDKKRGEIEEKYGPKVFGLDAETKKQLLRQFKPQVVFEARRQLKK